MERGGMVSTNAHPSPASGVPSALLLQKDPARASMLRDLLSSQGFEVHWVQDEAEVLTAPFAPSVTIIDLEYLPLLERKPEGREDGLDPTIVVGSYRAPDDVARAFTLGARDYVVDPIEPQIFMARVASSIRNAEERREARRTKEIQERAAAFDADLADARRIQLGQIPLVPARYQRWIISGAVLPCGAVGGDAFDIFEVGAGGRALALIDVSGHGIAAALVASCLQSELRGLMLTNHIDEAMAKLNKYLVHSGSGKYACVALVEMRQGEASVINAGLPPVAVLRNGEVIHRISGAGVPPGLMSGQKYNAEDIPVEVGDQIILMTDGMTEPFGPMDDVDACFGRMGLLDPDTETFAFRNTRKVKRALRTALNAAPGSAQVDDATVVALQFTSDDRINPWA